MSKGDHPIACVGNVFNVSPEFLECRDEIGHGLYARLAPTDHCRRVEIRVSLEVDDVWSHELRKDADDVAVVEGFVSPAHNLHVLLRHRLLREPHGFEGLVPGEVLLYPGDQTFVQREDVEEAGVHPHPAVLACTNKSDYDEDVIAPEI